MSASQVNGDELSGYNLPGFQGGFFTMLPLNDKSALQLEISFVQKGARELPSDTSIFYRTRLNYISVPLLYRLHWGDQLAFEIGPVFDILANAEESDQSGEREINPPYKNFHLAGLFAINYNFNEEFWISFRTVNSITTIREGNAAAPTINSPRLGGNGQRNLILTFGLYYAFF